MTGTDTKPVSDPAKDESGEAEMDGESLHEFVEETLRKNKAVYERLADT